MKEMIQSLPFKTKLNIHYLLCGLGGIMIMIGCHFSQNQQLPPLAWLGIALLAAGLIWRIAFIKCPHCGDGLYQQRVMLDKCPNCGEKLE